MGKLTLPARVTETEEGCQATIDRLDLTGSGLTPKEAQDDLLDKFRSWVQACDGQEKLEEALAEVGYEGVEEDTELEMVFVE